MNKLRPWQVKPVYQLLDILRHSNAVDLSDTGTGKTYVACAVAAQIDLPLSVAVIPKIAHSSWQAAAKHFDFKLPTIGYEALRTGRSPFGKWENQPPVLFKSEEFFVCESCQCRVDFDDYRPCYCHPEGLHCVKVKKKAWEYGKFIWNDTVKLIIFDEIHRCSALDSLNADMLIAAKWQNIRVLGLSATAACSPLQMRALGFALDLHGLNQNMLIPTTANDVLLKGNLAFKFSKTLPTFYQWAGRYECRPDPVYRGLKWFAGADRQAEIMANIHGQLIPARGVRVRTQDIPGFPERIISAELYDLEKDYEIEKLYQEMAHALDALSQREAQDASTELPLTRLLRARQRVELLKVPLFVELAEDDLAKGNSVAIFVNFQQTIDELRKRLHAFKPGVVDGSPEGVRSRGEAITNFQSNENRLIILNSAAGGVAISLHDTSGGHPRIGLISPGQSAVQFRQICGRLNRDGGKSPALYRVILAARTVETKMKKALDNKLTNLDSLNDSDFQPEREI